jgi:hypothetical protein
MINAFSSSPSRLAAHANISPFPLQIFSLLPCSLYITGITEKDPRLLGLIRPNIVHKPLLVSYGIGDITRDYNGIFYYYKALKGL